MSSIKVCDYCKHEMQKDSGIRIEFVEDSHWLYKDYHTDCFNYKFSCDIRKIKDEN